jgi:hypothetical protein
MMTPDELAQLMFRCDRAIGKLREERLSRRNADELIGATMSLMNRIRVEQNSSSAMYSDCMYCASEYPS